MSELKTRSNVTDDPTQPHHESSNSNTHTNTNTNTIITNTNTNTTKTISNADLNLLIDTDDDWNIIPSELSQRVVNPIRRIVDRLQLPKNATQPLISLSIGDPTIFGNMLVDSSIEDELIRVIKSRQFNGYPPAHGYAETRRAIAEKYSIPDYPVTENDVLVGSGCSGAIAIAIPSLANVGDNMLIPVPGFSLYQTIGETYGIECRYYNLLPDQSWEVDLKHCESLIDSRTKFILINNPSNPCGSNYSREHLLQIIAFARKHHIPILADEIYAEMVFRNEKFHYLAACSPDVPIISVGGIAKQYLVPGWRIGWLVVHDRFKRLEKARAAMISMSQLILGGNSLIQAVVPFMLNKTPTQFYQNLINQLEEQAMFCVQRISAISGLTIIPPQGSMYLMVKIHIDEMKDIVDDVDFCNKLLNEEVLVVLPGACFRAHNFFRIVYCASIPALEEACNRLSRFVARHRVC